MPSMSTEKLGRLGTGKPHRCRLRILWPDDAELQEDSEKSSKNQAELFILEMQDADKENQPWVPVVKHKTLAATQVAADDMVGRKIKTTEWREDGAEGGAR